MNIFLSSIILHLRKDLRFCRYFVASVLTDLTLAHIRLTGVCTTLKPQLQMLNAFEKN